MNASIHGLSSPGENSTPKELFRLRNVETQLNSATKYYIGDLVFTDSGVSLVQRAEYTNLWGNLQDGLMPFLLMFLPAGFLCAVAGGAIVFSLSGEEETFDVGGIIGAVLSIPLSILVISRINRTSQKNAAEMLEKAATSDPPLSPQTRVAHISRENLSQINYDPGEQTLRIEHKKGTIVVTISYDEWEKGSEQASKYIVDGASA